VTGGALIKSYSLTYCAVLTCFDKNVINDIYVMTFFKTLGTVGIRNIYKFTFVHSHHFGLYKRLVIFL